MKKYFLRSKSRQGFTLVELLITIAVIGILMTFSIIYVRGAYFRAKDVQAAYNVKQIQTALLLYFADNGHFPDGSLVMNVDGMCLTENGFETCDQGGGTGQNGLINVAKAADNSGQPKKIYLANVPRSTYAETDNVYVADQGGQWYTIFYKTKDAIKRAVPEDRKDSYPLASQEVRNWRIKTDIADVVNMMNDFYKQKGQYPTIESACFRNSKACILTSGEYIADEATCNDAKQNNPESIYFSFSTISGRGFLGDTDYCIKNSNGSEFYIEYDIETVDGHDSSKANVYKKHLRDLFRAGDFGGGSSQLSGSIFNPNSKKTLEKNNEGKYSKTYWTDFFKNGMKTGNSDHGN